MLEKIRAKDGNGDWSQLEGPGETPGSKLEQNKTVSKSRERGFSSCEKTS